MPRYVALLRGINVGGHRVKMDKLRALMEHLLLEEVDTFIASGNVLFTSPSEDVPLLEARIENHLAAALGYEVPTFIRTPDELRAVADFLPEPDHPDHSAYVMFASREPDASERSALEALSSDMDSFVFHGREIYWLIAGKMSASPLFGGDVGKAMKRLPHTARNMTSIRKLLAQKVKEAS
jgi:uncharacterized protein (DUF1697 family)